MDSQHSKPRHFASKVFKYWNPMLVKFFYSPNKWAIFPKNYTKLQNVLDGTRCQFLQRNMFCNKDEMIDGPVVENKIHCLEILVLFGKSQFI